MGDNAVHDLTAAYALDALEPDEARGYEEHLAGCERCREELASLQSAAGALAYAVEPSHPPESLRGRILAAAHAERPNVVPLQAYGPYARHYRRFAAVAAVAACTAVGLGIWNITLHDRLGHARAALRGVPLTGAKGSVIVSGDNAALVVSDLGPAPAGQTYEAWVIEDGHASRAGTFTGSGRTIVIHLTHALPAGAVVAVTVERAGGVDQPTKKPFITSQRV
jgi:anti-sigma-K factor RskA